MFDKITLFYLNHKINLITLFIFIVISLFFTIAGIQETEIKAPSLEVSATESSVVQKSSTNTQPLPVITKEVIKKDAWIELGHGIKISYLNKTSGKLGGSFGNYHIDYKTMLSDGKAIGNGSKIIQIEKSIQGWRLAFPLIPEGSTFKLFVPADVAYSQNGVPGIIPPNEPLFFNITINRVSDMSESIRTDLPLMLKVVFMGDGNLIQPGQTLRVLLKKSFFPFHSFHINDEMLSLTLPDTLSKNNWKKILVGKSIGSKLQLIIPTSMDLPEISEHSPKHDMPIYLNLYIVSILNNDF